MGKGVPDRAQAMAYAAAMQAQAVAMQEPWSFDQTNSMNTNRESVAYRSFSSFEF
jgi:hypothetical protein